MISHKYIAESMGAFFLSLAVLLTLAGNFPVATPVVAGLTLAMLVYILGPISGAHVNPAVTVGLWAVKKIKTPDAAAYIVAQLIGAGLAWYAAGLLITPANLVTVDSLAVGLAELIGAFFLLFGISAVVNDSVHPAMSGLVVGGSLLVGLALAGTVSNAVLNPAVALGIGSFSLMYVLGPLVGAVLATKIFAGLKK